MDNPPVHLHLVSDGTGETVRTVARAAVGRFDGLHVRQHFWVLIRSRVQMRRAIDGIVAEPGMVLATVLDERLRDMLEDACGSAGAPFVSLLDEPVAALSAAAGRPARVRPGRPRRLDESYFALIDAMQFTMNHDDGQAVEDLEEADIVLMGVSRTSKTPTCVYLANRGYKAANVPFVPEVPLPRHVRELSRPLVVGLTVDPNRLVQVRRNRFRTLREHAETNYIDLERVRDEVAAARRLFAERNWPVIDVTRRSIEETAAGIVRLLERRRAEQ